jgi:hypothetical protein
MKKYKIVLNPNSLIRPETESGLNDFRGYLSYDLDNIEPNLLVNENNVTQYLTDTGNTQVTSRFVEYLSANTTNVEFREIYYTSYKVAPILNDFYNKRIRFNIEPNLILIYDALDNTELVSYKNNNFDFEKNKRKNLDNKETLIEKHQSNSTIDDYYIDVSINVKQNFVFSTDYSQYLADCVEDGVVLKNCFVNLNKKTDPFEFWTNNKPQLKPIQNLLLNNIIRRNI